MLPIAAYADRLSVRPGQTIRFHAGASVDAPITARIARVICADANPAGPGIRMEPIESTPERIGEPGDGTVPRGSYAIVDGAGAWFGGDDFTLVVRVHPLLVPGREQAIAARTGGDGGIALLIGPDGRLRAAVGNGIRTEGPEAGQPLAARRWYLAWLRLDAKARTLTVGHAPTGAGSRLGRTPDSATHALTDAAHPDGEGPLLFAAAGGASPALHFSGKLEAPAVWTRALDDEEIAALADGEVVGGAAAAWDLGAGAAGDRIEDTGPGGFHGRVINTPTRGMTGATWRGGEMCFRHAPQDYGAIHFHEDDIDDCRWPAVYEWTVPAGTRSGVYALLIGAGEATDNVPFHVVPPKGKATAPMAVLASTFTYTVYGNHARPDWHTDPAWRACWIDQAAAWGAYPEYPGTHPEYGLSTYNLHTDGSGVSISSWHRPMLNVRIGYITYPDEALRGSGLRHFPADTHLYAWLEAKGYDFDIVTDHELHHEGAALLERYRVVMTGSHPEYHTRAMLDAIEAYRNGGGRLCYMGGNGFYWKIALAPERDGVVEIRRGEGGIRAWAAEPGEYYNQFDGEYGGLWRRNGRPPQHLAGVGFTAQGGFVGSHYRLRPEAESPRVAWMFAGIEAETFGDHGLSGHGAAGFELDRADKRLGTPDHAVVMASSENHPPEAPWVLVPEEVLTHTLTWPDEPAGTLIRADLTFFETPAGGAVFSTGSITFCGSLPTNDFDNDVSTLVGNVLDRFLDPTPFEMPSG